MSSASLLCFCVVLLASQTSGANLPSLLPALNGHINRMKIGGPVANVFKFKNCGGPKDMANFTSLSVSPDPITVPGKVKVSFEIDVMETVQGDLSLNVTLALRVGGSWHEVPCVLDVGSCYYPGVCDYLQPIEQCPQPFIQHNIPCRCPFRPGKYRLPGSTFDLDQGLPSADYFIKVVLKQSAGQVACAEAIFTFSEA
ncbi:hypothetical protein RRG08_047958 [Elysia crispata]|uniref:MD-2-related lipid-recognition domain-containing protein n=1 Tax=Elysia crispata TaxID=231223 RepID=A0AAE0ZW71_9GAST|nr:hypothetical protein RRG08_047958 [Elysia crispata]